MQDDKKDFHRKTPGELWFRLVFSLAGLAMIGLVIAIRGIPRGPALFEVIGVAGAFFGGTAVWSILQLGKRR